jgi:hypothetical protein
MTAKRTRKSTLCVASTGNQHYIQVPSDRSADLLSYLRRSGLHVAPPGPCTTGSETIALLGRVDTGAVQGILDRWQ